MTSDTASLAKRLRDMAEEFAPTKWSHVGKLLSEAADALSSPIQMDEVELREILAQEYERVGHNSDARILRDTFARFDHLAGVKQVALAAMRSIAGVTHLGCFCPYCNPIDPAHSDKLDASDRALWDLALSLNREKNAKGLHIYFAMKKLRDQSRLLTVDESK